MTKKKKIEKKIDNACIATTEYYMPDEIDTFISWLANNNLIKQDFISELIRDKYEQSREPNKTK